MAVALGDPRAVYQAAQQSQLFS